MNHLRLILILLAVVSVAPGILGQAFGKNVLGSLLLHRRHSTTAPTSRVKFVTQRHTAPRRVSTTRAPEPRVDTDAVDAKTQPGKPTNAAKNPTQPQIPLVGLESRPRNVELVHAGTKPELRVTNSE